MSADWLADEGPRLQLMVRLILRNRAAICEPKKGVLELHFNGRHVSAHLVGYQALQIDDNSEPPSAA